mmetsp:Transcript_59804/g.118790  ORF Transcript_59804/g.118790 Transcript_59804/m.118790 type:complete len:156 (-) Transcript_59804:18-485(-)
MSRKYGWHRVVIGSDSATARRQFQGEMAAIDPSLRLQVHSADEKLFGDGLREQDVMVEAMLRVPSEGRDSSRAWLHTWTNSTAPQWEAFESFVTDLHAMASCHALVAKLTSNIARLVLELISARLGRVPPYISLDAPWCFGGRAPSPHGRGFFAC